MISRSIASILDERLTEAPAVALIGPRQVGKTTLARAVADARGPEALYLDLEQQQDRTRLSDPAAYLSLHAGKLVILDEIHRAPEIFDVLRGQIDARRRLGRPFGHFLILGSAALSLLRQSSESLAGRIAYLEMTPLLPSEISADAPDVSDEVSLPSPLRQLWLRGGFPSSYLAASDAASLRWRLGFIRSYLERDIPQFGVRVPTATLERFWTMLAHVHGGLLNAQQLAGALGVAWHTASHYLNLMEDLLLIRRLAPYAANVGKRLVKSPKLYIRDTGLLHALLGLRGLDDLLGHPVAGASFESYVIETLIAALPDGAKAFFYRTQAGAEIDLVIEIGPRRLVAVEIKSSTAPAPSRGFHSGCADLKPIARWVVYPGREAFPLSDGVEAISLVDAARRIAEL
ncbi:MAG: ATP-binding protein [Beijerinckiaceae bacterium]